MQETLTMGESQVFLARSRCRQPFPKATYVLDAAYLGQNGHACFRATWTRNRAALIYCEFSVVMCAKRLPWEKGSTHYSSYA